MTNTKLTNKLALAACLLNFAQATPRNTVRGEASLSTAASACHAEIMAEYEKLVLTQFQQKYSEIEAKYMELYRAHTEAFGTPENVPTLNSSNTDILAKWTAQWKLPPTRIVMESPMAKTPRNFETPPATVKNRDVSPDPNATAGGAASSSAPVAPLRVNLSRRSRTSVEQAPTTPVVTPRNVTSPQSEGAARAVNFQDTTPTSTPRQATGYQNTPPAFGRKGGSPGRASHNGTSPGGRSSCSSRSAVSQMVESDLSPQSIPDRSPIFSFNSAYQASPTPIRPRDVRSNQAYLDMIQARDADNILRLTNRVVFNPHATADGKTCYIAKIRGNPEPMTVRIYVDGYRGTLRCIQDLNTFEEQVYFNLKQNLGSGLEFSLVTNPIQTNLRSDYLVRTVSVMPDFVGKFWGIAQDHLPHNYNEGSNIRVTLKDCETVFESGLLWNSPHDIQLTKHFLVGRERLEVILTCEVIQSVASLADPLGATMTECVSELFCVAKQIEDTMKLKPGLKDFRDEILKPLTNDWKTNLRKFGHIGIYMSKPDEL